MRSFLYLKWSMNIFLGLCMVFYYLNTINYIFNESTWHSSTREEERREEKQKPKRKKEKWGKKHCWSTLWARIILLQLNIIQPVFIWSIDSCRESINVFLALKQNKKQTWIFNDNVNRNTQKNNAAEVKTYRVQQ